jgi:hypothetical protein
MWGCNVWIGCGGVHVDLTTDGDSHLDSMSWWGEHDL